MSIRLASINACGLNDQVKRQRVGAILKQMRIDLSTREARGTRESLYHGTIRLLFDSQH